MNPFKNIPQDTQKILMQLEEKDQRERDSKIARTLRLRQIPRETGEFLYQFLLTFVPQFSSQFIGIEIGTSGGYSTIWQASALRTLGYGKLLSIDNDPVKYSLASNNINNVELGNFVNLIQDNALEYLKGKKTHKIHYYFIDAEKEDYKKYYQLITNNPMPSGAVLLADNVISHAEELLGFLDLINNDPSVSSIIVPIGKGLAFVRWK